MEFNEKLQQLRKGKGLTQEELAEVLFVSRTAVSKWESGRGFPNIESLKAISKYFSVSLDELLSGEEILAIAEKDQREKERNFQSMIVGLLDCGIALMLFLPLFGQLGTDGVQSVSLLALEGIQPYLKAAYVGFVSIMTVLGILNLALQNCSAGCWGRHKNMLSLVCSILGVCLFVISQQPYGTVFVFVFLVVKTITLMKRR